jgi:hypothetical protein
MLHTQRFLGIFFGALAAFFLLRAFRGSGAGRPAAAKTHLRIGLAFGAVCLYLLLNPRL